MTSEQLAALEQHLQSLSALIEEAKRRPGLGLSETDKRRLDEQARRVGDSARYFLMGP